VKIHHSHRSKKTKAKNEGAWQERREIRMGLQERPTYAVRSEI